MKKRVGLILGFLLVVNCLYIGAYEFCDDGVVGENDLRIISVDDMLKDNSKEWVWETGDDIELEIRIENKDDESGDYRIELVFVQDDDEEDLAENENDLEVDVHLSANERKSVSVNFEVDKDVDKDDYELYVKLYRIDEEDDFCVENSEEVVTIDKIEICSDEIDDDDLEIIEIYDYKIDNEKEWVWAPGNEIRIAVEVKNKDLEFDEFVLELIMLDENNQEVNFATDMSELIVEEDIEEDSSEKITLDFFVENGLEEGKYSLYAKIYNEDEDVCASLRAADEDDEVEVEIEKEKHRVVIDDITGPTEINAGDLVSYSVRLENFGSEDEEQVSIVIYNFNLGLKQTQEIYDLDSGECQDVVFEFNVPENVSSSRESIVFLAEFDYSSSKDYYKDSTDDDDIRYSVQVNEKVQEVVEDIENNEIVVDENILEEFVNESLLNNTEVVKTIVTGNAIGGSKSGFGIGTIIIILIVIGLGGFVSLRVSQRIKYKKLYGRNY